MLLFVIKFRPVWRSQSLFELFRLTSSVLVTDVGEPPDVPQVHGEAHDREEELHFLVPCFSPPVGGQSHHHHPGDVVLVLLGIFAVLGLDRRLLAVVLTIGLLLVRMGVLLAVVPFRFGHCGC